MYAHNTRYKIHTYAIIHLNNIHTCTYTTTQQYAAQDNTENTQRTAQHTTQNNAQNTTHNLSTEQHRLFAQI